MTTKAIIIDPGGLANVREGINVITYPEIYNESFLDLNVSRTANANLVVSGLKERYEIEWQALVSSQDFTKIRGMLSFNRAQRADGKSFEVVIYNFFEPFSEYAPTRSRFRVPAQSNLVADGPDSFGLTQYSYYIALQGHLDTTYERKGDCQLMSFKFSEGTALKSGDE